MAGWKPIEIAPKDTEVLVYAPFDGVRSSTFKYGCWQRLTMAMLDDKDRNEPTHWMPLPEPPEDK